MTYKPENIKGCFTRLQNNENIFQENLQMLKNILNPYCNLESQLLQIKKWKIIKDLIIE